MSRSHSSLSRRTFLRGLGVGLALPFLDCMEGPASGLCAASTPALPKRLCAVYFPFGVSLPPKKHEHSEWNWFPHGEGRDYSFTRPLSSLESLRQHVTILSGLSHPMCRKLGGHDTGDTFLTASDLGGTRYKNSISIDQVAAEHVGAETRLSSLVLSSDGGVGEPTRATTLSFSKEGRPIPALASPRQIFERLFGAGDLESQAAARRLENSKSILDLVLDQSRSIERRLGANDRRKLDEYLDSVRAVEQRVERSQRWLNIPKPKVDRSAVDLSANPDGPKEYIRAMYDLIFLAFQTDTTRIATYMLGQVAGATTVANTFPACIGLKGNWHGLAHGAGKKGGFETLGKFDQFLAEQHSYFLTRLSTTPEGEGSMLDRTLVLYGSSNSRTHNNRNYPLVLAGGTSLGMQHGKHIKFSDRTPLSNLYVTMLDRVGAKIDSFGDSSAEMSEVTHGGSRVF
ncbi:MAG: DUF1552 domain-containing protein [Planctomycetota bacterium]